MFTYSKHNPYDLKQTYEYVVENYGVNTLNKITSILKVQKSRIKEIELLNIDQSNKMINLSAAISLQSVEEIKKIIEVCRANNIEITGSVFFKKSKDLIESIEYVKNNYGQEYLKPLIINKNFKYLMQVFPYL